MAAVWLALALAMPCAGLAADLTVIGVFPGRGAVFVVNGGAPQTVRLGQKIAGWTLVSVDKAGAVIEETGRRRSIGLGQHVNSGSSGTGRAQQVVLSADRGGHFISEGTVNGGATLRFLVDTGATMVSLPGSDARRMGIDFAKGQKGITITANGPVPAYRVKLDSVKLGEIELLNVDALVLDGGGLTQPLLGMSFLNRVEMRRDGDTMTLVRRF